MEPQRRTSGGLQLVRAAPADLIDDAATTVAMTPSAVASLEMDGHPYIVIDDLIDRAATEPSADEYAQWQVEWFQRLDDRLEADGAVVASSSLLKTPIDAVVLSARTLRALLDAAAPDRCTYVGRLQPGNASPWHGGHLQPWPSLGDLPLTAQLLPLLCEQKGLPYEPVAADEAGFDPRPPADPKLPWLRQILGPARNLGLSLRSPRTRSATLFLWTGGYGLRPLVQQERGLGRRVLMLKRGGATTGLLELGRLGYRLRGEGVTVDLSARPLLEVPDLRPLLREVDEWARLDGAATALVERVALFCGRVVPAVRDAALTLRAAIEREQIDQVVAANPSSPEEFSALLAAAPIAPRVLVQHGDHAYGYAAWQVTELQSFEALRSSDPSAEPDIRRTLPPGRSLEITFDNPRLPAPRSRPATSRRNVGYLPMITIDESYAVAAGYLDGAWYHRWHRMLAAELGARRDVKVIWKALPQGDQAPDPLADVLPSSIRFETRPFPQVIDEVDALITDYLSTGLYEAINAGLPVLALHFPQFGPLRPEAEVALRPSLRTCRSMPEAVAHVQEFLNGSWSDYVVPTVRPALGTARGTDRS